MNGGTQYSAALNGIYETKVCITLDGLADVCILDSNKNDSINIFHYSFQYFCTIFAKKATEYSILNNMVF